MGDYKKMTVDLVGEEGKMIKIESEDKDVRIQVNVLGGNGNVIESTTGRVLIGALMGIDKGLGDQDEPGTISTAFVNSLYHPEVDTHGVAQALVAFNRFLGEITRKFLLTLIREEEGEEH